MSKKVEYHIKRYEAVLDQIRELINDKGEVTARTQQVIDETLDALAGWYEMRNMFG